MRSPLLLLTLGCVLVVGIMVAVFAFTIDVQRISDSQANLFRQSVGTGLLFSAIQDAETSQRGFLIAREEAYLKPLDDAVAALPGRFDALREAFAGRPDQLADLASLQQLADERLAVLRQTIALVRSGQSDAAATIVKSGRGREIMDQIRVLVARMRDRQREGLQAAAMALQSTGALLRFGVGAAAVLVLFLAGFAFAEKRRQRLAVEQQATVLEENGRALEEANRQLTSEMQSREAVENQLRQVMKIEAIGQLTGGLAHDFNNMLAVILSAINLAERRLASGQLDIGKYLEAAADAANRAANLTRRLLAFARQQPLQPDSVDANRMVSGMSELLRRTLGEAVQLETVLAGGLWRTHTDPNQLENAILNLAVNARDAMPEGGRITIETSNAHLDDGYVMQNPGAKAGQYVLIAVTDTGKGMTAEVLAKAFDPFFTTKAVGKGTGLGLSQVFGFVKQSNGHIKIYSEAGQGTTVKLYLPRQFGVDLASDAPSVKHTVTRPKVPLGREQEVILLVEDEERVRSLSADALQEIGYRVITADSAKAALELIDRNPDIVLLFTDIVMPEMNGRALADAALAIRPGLKVLYTTGFTRNAVVHNGILDPGVNFIAKPFTFEHLATKVREAIDS